MKAMEKQNSVEEEKASNWVTQVECSMQRAETARLLPLKLAWSAAA